MRLRRWVLLTAGTAALAVAALSCGGSGDDDANGDDDPNCVPVAPEAARVDQDDLQFKPTKLCVKSGQPVTFKNSESALHTVTIEGKNESGNMKKDDTFEWTAPGVGAYAITCEFHPQMKARIQVVS